MNGLRHCIFRSAVSRRNTFNRATTSAVQCSVSPAECNVGNPFSVPLHRGAISIHPTDVLAFPIKTKIDAGVKFTRAYVNPNFLKVAVKHWNDIKEGFQYAIIEAVVPAGEFECSIELQVSEPVNQRIRIPVYGHVVEQSATRKSEIPCDSV